MGSQAWIALDELSERMALDLNNEINLYPNHNYMLFYETLYFKNNFV